MIPIREAAIAMGISEVYVRKLCRQKRIRAKKVGRDWVVFEDALLFYTIKKDAIRESERKRGRPKGAYGSYKKRDKSDTTLFRKRIKKAMKRAKEEQPNGVLAKITQQILIEKEKELRRKRLKKKEKINNENS